MVLEAKSIKKKYVRGDQSVEALKGVTLSLKPGQFTSIMGPSGSGKSTLVHIIGGLDRPTSGSVCLEGQAIEAFSDHELSVFRRRRLGFIFQFFNLLPTLTALENVALPLLLDGQSIHKIGPKAEALLSQIGMGSRIHHRPDQLSGGEMQRVAIARALIGDPILILADEPTGNLDSKTGTMVLEILAKMARERGNTILMVTHDIRAASYGNRLVTLRDGLIETDGLPVNPIAPDWQAATHA
jgi:putative ABC transport system ATP-binding protein